MRWFYLNRYIFFVFLFSLLPFGFWFSTPHLVHTHDGLVHLPRIAAFYKELVALNIPVRWASDLNFGYGMPLFVFIYHTPYIVSSFFLVLGLSLVNAFKLSFLTSFLLSGLFMFLFTRRLFKNEKIAFFTTLLYQFAPFHLVDLLIRGSFGEVYTYALLPLSLYFLLVFFETLKVRYLIFTSVATTLLVLSHNSISLLFFGVIVLFVLFFAKDFKQRFFAAGSLLGGLMLSAYYWIPALVEHKFTYGDLYMKDLYRTHFLEPWKLIVPNLTDAQFLQTDHLSLTIGLVQTLAIVAAIVWLVQKKRHDEEGKRIIVFSVFLIGLAVYFMLPISLLFWENISFLRQFQFPWRFLTIIVFASSLIGVFLYPYVKKKIVFISTILLVVFSSFVYWIPKEGVDIIDESYYWNFPLTTTYYGETDVIWSAGPQKEYPENRIDIIAGDGEILSQSTDQPTYQTLFVRADTDVTLVSHTQYFPGWRVYRFFEREEIPIQFQDPNYRGLITFTLPKGEHDILIQFGESKTRLIANVISLSGVVLVVIASFVFWKKSL